MSTRHRMLLVAGGCLVLGGLVLAVLAARDDGASTTAVGGPGTEGPPTVRVAAGGATTASGAPSTVAKPGTAASTPPSGARTATAPSRARPPAPSAVGPVAVDPATLFPTGPLRARVSSWPLDPGSAAYISRLRGLDLVVSLRQWTVAVYGAAPTTPRTDVALKQTWGTGLTRLEGVPIPAGALPDPAGDGHLSVVQAGSGCVYDLFRAKRSGGSWTAGSGNAVGLGSSGIYPGGGGTRASGFSAALGLVWPQEIASGRIDHALVFAYPYTRSGAPVAPATRSDGRTSSVGALPMGARLRLDPSLDLATLGLNHAESVIARALQEYGMVLGDTSGGFTLYAAHPRGLGYDPYPRLFGTTSDWASLARIPKDRFQVLSLPASASAGGPGSSCARLR